MPGLSDEFAPVMTRVLVPGDGSKALVRIIKVPGVGFRKMEVLSDHLIVLRPVDVGNR